MSVVLVDGWQLVLNVLLGVLCVGTGGSCFYCDMLMCCCRREHSVLVLC